SIYLRRAPCPFLGSFCQVIVIVQDAHLLSRRLKETTADQFFRAISLGTGTATEPLEGWPRIKSGSVSQLVTSPCKRFAGFQNCQLWRIASLACANARLEETGVQADCAPAPVPRSLVAASHCAGRLTRPMPRTSTPAASTTAPT